MARERYKLNISGDEYDSIVYALIDYKNKLLSEDYMADDVDDLLIRLLSLKPRFI